MPIESEFQQPLQNSENREVQTTFMYERGDPPERLLEEQPGVLELAPFKEIWVPTFNILTTSGHPGSGKTLQSMAIAYCYGIDLITPSQKFREQAVKMGQLVRGGVMRPEEMDMQLDKDQLELIKDTIKEDNSILLESRLGGVITTEYMLQIEKKRARNKSIKEPKIVRALFVANREERARRVAERDGTTIEQAKKDTSDREHVDFLRWQSHHAILKNVNDVFDPALVSRSHGRQDNRLHGPHGRTYIYDFMIRTSNQSFEESFMSVHSYLAEHGHIMKVEEMNNSDEQSFTTQGGDIVHFI